MQQRAVILMGVAAIASVTYAVVLIMSMIRRDDGGWAERISLTVFGAALVVGIGSATIGSGFSPARSGDVLVIGMAFGTAASGTIAWARAGGTSRVGILVGAGFLAGLTAHASSDPA